MTSFDATQQALTCLYLFLSGILSGLIYDVLCPLRRASKPLCAIADVVFALCAAALCAISLAYGGADCVRTYAIASYFLGAVLFRFTLGALWRHIFSRIRQEKGNACRRTLKPPV